MFPPFPNTRHLSDEPTGSHKTVYYLRGPPSSQGQKRARCPKLAVRRENTSEHTWSRRLVAMQKNYRLESELAVLSRAHELVGMSLRDLHGNEAKTPKGKGAFGQMLEQLHFGYEPNSLPELDFPIARLELKATGAIPRTKGWFAKERLVLSNINYTQLIDDPEFETSAFYLKNARLLVVVYYWMVETSPLDYEVLGVGVVEIEGLDPVDRAIIKDDWKKIQEAVRAGRAHELSEGDTMYLKATRKGAGTGLDDRKQPNSPIPAPNRAFSFRQSFLTRLIQPLVQGETLPGLIDEQPLVHNPDSLTSKTFEEIVLDRFEPFIGQTVEQIARRVAPNINRTSKGFYADLARRMLGVTTRRIEEFEKADIVMKTVRVDGNGRPRESMSFPAFRYRNLAEQEWLDSDLRDSLSKRFLFVFYQSVGTEVRLHHAAFWVIPETLLDSEVKRVWDETVNRIVTGRAHDLPRMVESTVAHVRPHGRNAADTDLTPDGRLLPKKSFWLNASYIANVFRITSKA